MQVALYLEHFSLQQNVFSPELPFHLFIFSCLLLSVYSCKKRSLYLFFFSLPVYTVWCELPHCLGTQAVMLGRLIHSFLCSSVQNYLISVLITEAQFDFWDLMFTQIICTNHYGSRISFVPMLLIKHFPAMADENFYTWYFLHFLSLKMLLECTWNFTKNSTPWSFWNL